MANGIKAKVMEKGLITGTMVPNLEGHFYMTKFMEKVF